MSKLVKQTELELKEKIMDALGRAVADGVLDEAPLPAFIIEVPKERQNGDYSTNVAMAGAKPLWIDWIWQTLCLTGQRSPVPALSISSWATGFMPLCWRI